jgi:putative methionine-R-sulfoxide reductase with GAF domain
MKWEVSVIPKNSDSAQSAITIDAENWMDALHSGFDSLGGKGDKVKIISCLIKEDLSVWITDLTTKSTFIIKPVGTPLDLPPIPEPAEQSFLESKSSVSQPDAEASRNEQAVQSFIDQRMDLPPVPPPMLQHKVFYKKDENPGAESSVIYRERVISVAPDASKRDVTALVQYHFESLRREMERIQGSKYINIEVYDHEFKGNPKGLALAALSWQEWKNQAPAVVFPKEETSAAQARPPSVPSAPQAAAQPVHAPAAHDVPRRKSPSREIKPDEIDENQVLSEVFEELQDLFLVQNQDDAAQYVLNLAMNKIPVEAGTVFLADINTRDMLFAAVIGPTTERLKGQRLNLTKGIVGFAAREGAAIAIADVRKDPRFCSDFDQHGGFVTKSVLCAPAQYEGRTFGAIELVNRKGGDMFSQSEINVVSYLASQMAEFIATSLPSPEPDFFEEENRAKGKDTKAQQAKKIKPKPRKSR